MSTVCTLLGFKSVCLFGGMPKVKQVEEMRQPGVKCVVGTPGRVLDMVNDKSVSFSR
jgi:superfamily II DNA/RNA helicase